MVANNVLVVLQPGENKNGKSLQSLLDAAIRRAGSSGTLRLLGIGAESLELVEELSEFGFSEVSLLDGIPSEHLTASCVAPCIAEVLREGGTNYDLLCAASAFGKDVAPRVAALVNAGQASDVVAINEDGTFSRPLFAGDLIAEVEVLSPYKIITVRTSAFDGESREKSTPRLEARRRAYKKDESPNSSYSYVASTEVAVLDRPELGDASKVVSGGRALKSAENFEQLIFPLAEVLGAAVGASRAAVDSGFAPNDWQVGQTGKVVAPDLYIAIGISGAIQHLAGMKDSKTIIAINKDSEAPIFQVADVGLVGDLFTIVPELTEKLRAHVASLK
jgi:electron transfer flavoprotein alpha subunit